MANTPMISTKRVAISKANAQMVGIVAGAAFISIFCLVAAHAAWTTNRYQAKVTGVKEKAHKQLLANISNFNSLQTSYKAFDATSTNAIGGNSNGTGDNDGKNSKLVLDALPASYDFPALTSSIEKILTNSNLTITNITGTDDQLNQQSNTSSPTPQPVPMPFSFQVNHANYQQVQQLITRLEQSIRPIQIDSLTVAGGSSNMTVTVNAHTYYQPGKNLNITKQVVK
jgi:hypothetical protein